EVLARLGDGARAGGRGQVLAATFHPELTGEDAVHRRFLAVLAA
ncbi:MAG: pyridoxal 5'-phosphate synthase glutaminase subunit PdxT, partial [Thermoanaerobaculia bacterium]|nr:pyridoxal 5'-phosphate synthase glutaminase subunit PdxT [Thermoanaerobaculia bacterium]